jgi:hypothetical protein
MKHNHSWETAFERANPPVPPGFEQRHDALLMRLTQGERVQKKTLPLKPLIALGLLLLTAGALAAGSILGLGDFFARISPNQPPKVERLDAFRNGVQPHVLEQDGLRLTLHELVADGRWTYAAVMVEPQAADVLPVPFGEVLERPFGLTDQTDTRDYREYARDENLRPASVSVYLESDALSGDYFIDNAYDSQGRLMLYLGGGTPEGGQADYSLRIITTQEGTEKTDRSYPLAVQVLDEVITRVYPANLPVGNTGLVLKEAKLTLTALCAYLDVTIEGEPQLHADLMKDGDFWPRGLSMSVNGYEMDALPDSIDIRLEQPSTGETWDILGLQGE